MIDWNVVVTIQEHGFNQAREFLQKFGKLNKTEYFNVLVIQVAEIGAFLETVKSAITEHPAILECIARIMPVTNVFKFQTPLEFEEKAKAIVLGWLTELAGKRLHVRMHRRGFKGQLSSQIEERFLDSVILKSLVQQSQAAPIIDFDDPDYIIAVETVGQIAGFALWSREQLQQYPFLRID